MDKPDLSPKSKVTWGDKYGYAMQVTDQAEADAYFEECVQHQLSFGLNDRAAAENIERTNIGYWAGYGYNREQVERLFRCKHPVFGSVEENGHPTPEQALAKGIELGSKQDRP